MHNLDCSMKIFLMQLISELYNLSMFNKIELKKSLILEKILAQMQVLIVLIAKWFLFLKKLIIFVLRFLDNSSDF